MIIVLQILETPRTHLNKIAIICNQRGNGLQIYDVLSRKSI
uniref:Uncharacterized protein n=1 Tax=Anguilla anguilla TaxID=7936 RepID=A0A0E9VQ96_ANGAN